MSAHAEFLRAASEDQDLAVKLKRDFRKAPISDRDRCMLEFVEKLTLYPWMLVETDVEQLRQAGFSDVDILHIVLGSAHFNYLNRMADGIGIRFEYQSDLPEFQKPVASQKDQSPAKVVFPPRPRDANVTGHRLRAWVAYAETDDLESASDEPRNLFRIMGENPQALRLSQFWRRYHLAATPGLDARLRSELALFVSALNRCDYSRHWFQRQLTRLGGAPELSEKLAEGQIPHDIPLNELHLFEHALRLTREPWTTEERHIDLLRSDGLDEKTILQLTMLISYLSFENRVALGLGVPLEE